MRVAIIGGNINLVSEDQLKFAFDLGKALVDNGCDIINGGMTGIMEASAKGARASDKFEKHSLIAILPTDDISKGNKYSGIKLITHLGTGRNRLIVMNADLVVAIGGGAGTMNEITLSWELGKTICAYSEGEGWSTKVAGTAIDSRRSDIILPVKTTKEVIDIIAKQFGSTSI